MHCVLVKGQDHAVELGHEEAIVYLAQELQVLEISLAYFYSLLPPRLLGLERLDYMCPINLRSLGYSR